jgi:hypothetical protein
MGKGCEGPICSTGGGVWDMDTVTSTEVTVKLRKNVEHCKVLWDVIPCGLVEL